MRSMTAAWTTEKNKKTGASPVWILKIPFVAGTVYLSDRVVTYTGITILPWIASWGSIDEDISGSLSAPMVSDFSVGIIIDPDAATDIHDLLWSEAVETLDCELYLWFEGLTVATDPMLLMWTGNIVDFQKENELLYSVDLADQGVKLDKYVGRVITAAVYADADPDEIGKISNIIYGTVPTVPCRAVAAGAVDTLPEDLADGTTTFTVSGSSKISFPAGSAIVIQIDDEQIQATYTAATKTFSSVTRGYNSTTAAIHNKGASVAEVLTQYVYEVAGHPVKAIDAVYVDGILQSSGFTAYTGQTGDELTGFEGIAVIKFTTLPVIKKQTNLAIDEGSHAHSTSAANVTWRFDDATFGSGGGSNEGNAIDANMTSYASCNSYSGTVLTVTKTTPESHADAPVRMRVCMKKAGAYPTGTTFTFCGIHVHCYGNETAYSDWETLGASYDSWAEISAASGVVATAGAYAVNIYEVWAEIEVGTTINSAPAAGVALSGNSSADTVIGEQVTADVDGYQDDGDGTFTGTAEALIEQPDQIIVHFLYTQVAWPVADFVTDADTPFAADSYKFGVLINERKKLREWLAYMALQCRCWFRFAAGEACLTYRPDTFTSDKTIAKFADNDDHTTTMKISRSPLDEIVNVINLKYQRDWTNEADEPYQAVVTVSDATSISAYGEKEQPDTFLFDFVRDATMADDLADFYLAAYKDRKKVVTGEIFLDHVEVEFADAVTLTEAGGIVCEIRNAGISPGSADRNDRISITAREVTETPS